MKSLFAALVAAVVAFAAAASAQTNTGEVAAAHLPVAYSFSY